MHDIGLPQHSSGGLLTMAGHRTYDQEVVGLTPRTTWMGDCLQTGKPSQYITNQGQLSLPYLWGREIEYHSASLGLRWGAFTCVRQQVAQYGLLVFKHN